MQRTIAQKTAQKNREKRMIVGKRMRLLALLSLVFLLTGISGDVTKSVKAEVSQKLSLKVSTLQVKKVRLSWNAIEGVEAYLVYRAARPEGSYELVDSVKGGTLQFTDSNLARGTTGYYKVRAVWSIQNISEGILSGHVSIHLSGKPQAPKLTVKQKGKHLYFTAKRLYGVERAFLYYQLPNEGWKIMNVSKKSYAWYPAKEKSDHFSIKISAGSGTVKFYLLPYGRAKGAYVKGKKSTACKVDVK